jgi:arylsulfatase A-like enzyme
VSAPTGRSWLVAAALTAATACDDGATLVPVVVPVPVPVAVPAPAVDAAPAAPPAPIEHAVWRLGPNRLLAHRVVGGDLVVDAAAAGFARYTRFGVPEPRWRLRRTVDGAGAAIADPGRRDDASIDVPLTREQAAASHLVLRVHAEARRRRGLTVSINGRRAGTRGAIDLKRGWQTLVVPVAEGRLIAGENRIRFTSRDDDDQLALAWLRIGAAERTDPRRAASYDGDGDAFSLAEGAGVAWYVLVPEGAALVGAVDGDGCRIEVTARSGDGAAATGALGGEGARVDLAPLAGQVVRLALVAQGCPRARLRDAAIVIPGPPPAPLAPAPPPRYVVLWVMDALRADRVRPFQPGARAEVPSFDELAATGAVFRQYYVQGNESQTSHASVWTSTYPAVHNVRMAGEGGSWRIPPRLAVLGEMIEDAGLVTIGVTGNGFVTDSPGYARGFEEFRNMMREKGVINGTLYGEDVLAHALERLDERRDRPAFLFLGTVDTHSPWIARQPWIDRYDPEPYDGPHARRSNPAALGIRRGVMGCSRVPEARDLQRLLAIYDSAISYHDARLGDLVATLKRWGIYEQTMIIVTADHGEEWFEAGRCGHGASLRDSLVRVPLLVHYPAGIAGGVVVDEGVEGVDVVPTILDLLGEPAPAQAQGESLRGLAAGHGRGWVRPSYASQYEYAHAMRLGRWKVRVGRTGAPRLIDLGADPLEKIDLSGSRTVERRFLTDALGFFLAWRAGWKKAQWGVVSNLEPAGARALGKGGW